MKKLTSILVFAVLAITSSQAQAQLKDDGSTSRYPCFEIIPSPVDLAEDAFYASVDAYYAATERLALARSASPKLSEKKFPALGLAPVSVASLKSARSASTGRGPPTGR